tara:strand:- start:179 stop:478 length:300 start_codon:yes stop_codon:yes gene_type:complete
LIKKKKIKLISIRKVQSNFMLDLGILILVKQRAVPKTNPRFAMFEPITFDIAISDEPFNAELRLINSSGAEVAKETTVSPMTTFDKFNLMDKSTADFNK